MAAAAYVQNCTNDANFLLCILGGTNDWHDVVNYFYKPWIFSLIGSTIVGLTGVFPLWLIPIQDGVDIKTGESGGTLKILLSFAVGALLGDVFLHLLPEVFESELRNKIGDSHASKPAGLWVLCAFLFFVIIEKIITAVNEEVSIIPEQQADEITIINDANKDKEMDNNNCIMMNIEKNGFVKEYLTDSTKVKSLLKKKPHKNGFVQMPNDVKNSQKNGFKEDVLKFALTSECPTDSLLIDEATKKLTKVNGFKTAVSRTSPACTTLPNSAVNRLIVQSKKYMFDLFRKFFNPKTFPGYLNLLMNSLDNFTHGLSVGGSFLISFRVGVLSTFTILVHEIPHEVGDFAILLKSGFSRFDAARAQLITASGGIAGALAAVFFSGGLEKETSWILPLTAGGFIHIGLVTILPDLLKEINTKESLKQLGALLFGVIIMTALMFV